MTYSRISALAAAVISWLYIFAAEPYRELITLIDGSEIYGFVSRDDLNTGEIEVTADWTITSVPASDVHVNSIDNREYQLDSEIKDWLSSVVGTVPGIVSLASVTMTGELCNPNYLLYDQVLSLNSETLDKILLEDGDIIKYADLSPRRLILDWKKVARIDRMGAAVDNGIIEEIIDTEGNTTTGFIETQVLRHHRVVRTPEGRKITFLPKSIASINKRTSSPGESLLEMSPVIEYIVLEDNLGTDRLEGVIIENNRADRYFVILTESGDGEVLKKVKYADTKAILYHPK